MFITLEGLDGAGKSTVCRAITAALIERGISVLATREPGAHSTLAPRNLIRQLVLDNKSELSPHSEALLYATDRRLHLEKQIWPALASGKVVICDRHLDSSIAYQGARPGLTPGKVKTLQEWVVEGRYPDLTIYLDIEPALALTRLKKRGELDRIESSGLNYLNLVHTNYDVIIDSMFPHRAFVRVDASAPLADVIRLALAAIYEKLGLR